MMNTRRTGSERNNSMHHSVEHDFENYAALKLANERIKTLFFVPSSGGSKDRQNNNTHSIDEILVRKTK